MRINVARAHGIGCHSGGRVAGGRVAGGRILNFCFESKIKHLANIVFDLVAVSS
jgi:hypothetical protein